MLWLSALAAANIYYMNVETLEKISKTPALQDLEWWKCHDDPYYWLTTWARTLDVHGKENERIKPFPRKLYIKTLVDIWLNNKLLLVPKTRQMMMSWLFTSLYLWDAQFHHGRQIFFQSKKEDDANDLVKRSKLVFDNEPNFLRRYWNPYKKEFFTLNANPHNQGKHTHCRLWFAETNSEIRGIPEGGEIIRMHTASGILADEMAFQPEAANAFQAARPTISSKGRFTGVSTPEDGTFFEKMVFDRVEV